MTPNVTDEELKHITSANVKYIKEINRLSDIIKDTANSGEDYKAIPQYNQLLDECFNYVKIILQHNFMQDYFTDAEIKLLVEEVATENNLKSTDLWSKLKVGTLLSCVSKEEYYLKDINDEVIESRVYEINNCVSVRNLDLVIKTMLKMCHKLYGNGLYEDGHPCYKIITKVGEMYFNKKLYTQDELDFIYSLMPKIVKHYKATEDSSFVNYISYCVNEILQRYPKRVTVYHSQVELYAKKLQRLLKTNFSQAHELINGLLKTFKIQEYRGKDKQDIPEYLVLVHGLKEYVNSELSKKNPRLANFAETNFEDFAEKIEKYPIRNLRVSLTEYVVKSIIKEARFLIIDRTLPYYDQLLSICGSQGALQTQVMAGGLDETCTKVLLLRTGLFLTCDAKNDRVIQRVCNLTQEQIDESWNTICKHFITINVKDLYWLKHTYLPMNKNGSVKIMEVLNVQEAEQPIVEEAKVQTIAEDMGSTIVENISTQETENKPSKNVAVKKGTVKQNSRQTTLEEFIALAGSRERLMEAVDNLTAQQKEVFILKHGIKDLKCYENSEIADLLGKKATTVAVLSSMANKSIKLYLNSELVITAGEKRLLNQMQRTDVRKNQITPQVLIDLAEGEDNLLTVMQLLTECEQKIVERFCGINGCEKIGREQIAKELNISNISASIVRVKNKLEIINNPSSASDAYRSGLLNILRRKALGISNLELQSRLRTQEYYAEKTEIDKTKTNCTPEAMINLAGGVKELETIMQLLPPKDVKVLELYCGLNGNERHSREAIAEKIECSVNNVSKIISNINKRLGLCMGRAPKNKGEETWKRAIDNKKLELGKTSNKQKLVEAELQGTPLEILVAYFNTLTENNRKTVELVYGLNGNERHSVEEVAEILNATESAIYGRIKIVNLKVQAYALKDENLKSCFNEQKIILKEQQKAFLRNKSGEHNYIFPSSIIEMLGGKKELQEIGYIFSPTQMKVLELYCGLNGEAEHTRKQIAHKLNMSEKSVHGTISTIKILIELYSGRVPVTSFEKTKARLIENKIKTRSKNHSITSGKQVKEDGVVKTLGRNGLKISLQKLLDIVGDEETLIKAQPYMIDRLQKINRYFIKFR